MPPLHTQRLTVESINDFPDDVLTHILSFLPIRDAFRTTVLSKTWVSLCYSLPILHFDNKDVNNVKEQIQFHQMLNAVMFSPRSKHVTLKSFHLNCRSSDNCFTFEKWIEAAKQRRVEKLYLYLPKNKSLAPTIFCCETLVVLKLFSIHVTTMFRSSVDLPSLKTLYMCFVSFEDMKDLMKLLSGCPMLENLKTICVDANAGVTAGGYFKPLSKLINADINLFEVPLRAVYNVQRLYVFWMGHSLPNAEINSYYKDFPVFGNLTKLLLCWGNEGIHEWDEVVKILQNCPKLQAISISKETDSLATRGRDDWKYPNHVPECVLSHLTTCNITHYQAVEADFRFATYILQNARHLKVMKILHTSFSNPLESPQFLDDLSSCSSISPACSLSLSESF